MKKLTESYTWKRLDNAAKIFPAAVSGTDTQVFRFSCDLRDPVDPETLQRALDETLDFFSMYRSVMKRGFFWYYLEETSLRPLVREEYKEPCSRLYNRNAGGILFEATYYGKRINLEIFHVLSDGTGAMEFLIALVSRYCSLRYGCRIPMEYGASQSEIAKDSFQKYSLRRSKKENRFRRAYRLRGDRYPECRLKIITGSASAGAVLKEAHRFGATLTEYLCACLLEALEKEMPLRKRNRPLVIGIPVNLRRFFPSESARNFFSMSYVSRDCGKQELPFEEIVQFVKQSFAENLKKDRLAEAINGYTAAERNVFARITPLFLKDICLRYAYKIAETRDTAAFSNIGLVRIPKEAEPYVQAFDVCTGTNKLQLCACTFEDRLSMSFTSPFLHADVERNFFRRLTEAGIRVEIASNDSGEESK